MGHENVFHVEKHLNDALHNPPRRKRTHTTLEIAAASRALGRADDGLTRDRATSAEAPRARATMTLASNVRVVDGAVVRVDETTAGGTRGAVSAKSLAESGALGKAKRRKGLSEENRWRTMDRIENGGTAGGAALREARRAALGLTRRAAVAEDEDDGPVVVLAEELLFVDGWAVGKSVTPKSIDEDAPSTLEGARDVRLKPLREATIGRRKERKNRSKSSLPACGKGALSFDVDE
jgi:hypothetical protein